MTPRFLTDRELCEMLRISVSTLQRHLRQGPARRRHGNEIDLRLCRHVVIGGARRWPMDEVNKFLQG